MKVIPILARAGITGFESPAAEYTQLGINLDELLIDHRALLLLDKRVATRCKGLVFSMVICSLWIGTFQFKTKM